MEVRNRKNQKSEKSERTPEKETITVSNDYDWDFGSIAKNKLAKIQELDPGKFNHFYLGPINGDVGGEIDAWARNLRQLPLKSPTK